MNSDLAELGSLDQTSDRDTSSSLKFSSGTKYIKKGRENTVKEKRKMRNSRKRRLRKLSAAVLRRDRKVEAEHLKKEKEQALKKVATSERSVSTLRCMVRTFWERWRWENDWFNNGSSFSVTFYDICRRYH